MLEMLHACMALIALTHMYAHVLCIAYFLKSNFQCRVTQTAVIPFYSFFNLCASKSVYKVCFVDDCCDNNCGVLWLGKSRGSPPRTLAKIFEGVEVDSLPE